MNLLKNPRRKQRLVTWTVFLLILAVSQGLNVWNLLAGDNDTFIFGFPLVYYQQPAETEYAYLNVIFLVVDLLVLYAIARIIIFAYTQMTKYRVVKK